MVSVEEDCFISCPYCMESIGVRIDLSAGQDQFLSYDCEVCCRPISLSVQIDPEGNINTSVEKES